MRRVSLHVLAGIVVCLLIATSASAQVARVFLTGTGNDANDCTNQATPCRSLQGADNQCPVNGEIVILDNGGYGAATITKSLTVKASAGVVAFIARTVTVNIASTDKVVLRGLSMNGVVFGDADGIAFYGERHSGGRELGHRRLRRRGHQSGRRWIESDRAQL